MTTDTCFPGTYEMWEGPCGDTSGRCDYCGNTQTNGLLGVIQRYSSRRAANQFKQEKNND